MSDAMTDRMVTLALADLQERMSAEVDALCGPRGKHNGGPLVRFGKRRGRVVILGRWVRIDVPRVRDRETGREVQLSTYVEASDSGQMVDAVLRLADEGVSVRGYARAVTPAGVAAHGMSRAAVGRHLVTGMARRVAAFAGRVLTGPRVPAFMADGLGVGGRTFLAALATTESGERYWAAIVDHPTESTDAVRDMIRTVRANVALTDAPLVSIDGGAALAAGVAELLPGAHVQRCREHRLDNVLSAVPRELRPDVKRSMQAAWELPTTEALAVFAALGVELAQAGHVTAATILMTGMEPTMTVTRLGVTGAHGTTNPIESAFGGARRFGRRVTRWRDDAMRRRWTVSGLLQAESRMRRTVAPVISANAPATITAAVADVIALPRGARGTNRPAGLRGLAYAA